MGECIPLVGGEISQLSRLLQMCESGKLQTNKKNHSSQRVKPREFRDGSKLAKQKKRVRESTHFIQVFFSLYFIFGCCDLFVLVVLCGMMLTDSVSFFLQSTFACCNNSMEKEIRGGKNCSQIYAVSECTKRWTRPRR